MVSLNPCFVRALTAGDWRPHHSVSGCNAAMTIACEHIVILPNLKFAEVITAEIYRFGT
jgi:hypothetical protein